MSVGEITRTIPFLVSSDEKSGALNISADGSSFEVNLDEAIAIPRSAKEVTVQVDSATVWWVIPNVETGVNDEWSIDDGVGGPFLVTIPEGLYDSFSLEAAIESGIIAAGGPQGMFNFIADSATQKIIIRVNQAGVTIDFTIADSVRDILGFNSVVLGPTVAALTDFTANNQAAFNQVEYFLIHSDLVPQGIRIGNTFNQIISQVLITVAPGSQIVAREFNPPVSEANDLAGALKKRIRFWLTDDQNRLVNTVGETWSARLVIKYVEPVKLSVP